MNWIVKDQNTEQDTSAEHDDRALDDLWNEYLELTLGKEEDTTERRREVLKELMEADIEQDDDGFDR